MSTPTSNRPPLPATLGGTGFRARAEEHRSELGSRWRACGLVSEIGRLRQVLLTWPGEELRLSGAPDEQLMLAPVEVATIQQQAGALEAAYQAHGVAVHFLRSTELPPPNLIFMRDLFFMTPEGAVISRMAAEQRAGEERLASRALAELGIPILHTVRGRGTFEGADALWLNERTVLLGVGVRTNAEGAAAVTAVLAAMGVTTLPVPMPTGVQHLLGLVNFIDRDLAAVHAAKAPAQLRALLLEHGVELLELPPTPELLDGRGMNFVALAPRQLLMPAGCPQLAQAYRARAVEVNEVDVSEYLKAAGGVGCLTGILERDS